MAGPLAVSKGPSGHHTGTRDGRGVRGRVRWGLTGCLLAGQGQRMLGPVVSADRPSGTWVGGPRRAASLMPSELLEAPKLA